MEAHHIRREIDAAALFAILQTECRSSTTAGAASGAATWLLLAGSCETADAGGAAGGAAGSTAGGEVLLEVLLEVQLEVLLEVQRPPRPR